MGTHGLDRHEKIPDRQCGRKGCQALKGSCNDYSMNAGPEGLLILYFQCRKLFLRLQSLQSSKIPEPLNTAFASSRLRSPGGTIMSDSRISSASIASPFSFILEISFASSFRNSSAFPSVNQIHDPVIDLVQFIAESFRRPDTGLRP